MLAVWVGWMLLWASLTAQTTDPAYAKQLKQLYQGTVPLVMPAEIQAKLGQDQNLVVLDTRSRKEYEVSHLKGALFVDYDHFRENSMAHLAKTTPIVVYCSVGYRSERIGERLQKMGFKNVQNLYGGIFEWVNQGFPVVTSGNKPTTRVHTYDKNWGQWLLKGEKVTN